MNSETPPTFGGGGLPPVPPPAGEGGQPATPPAPPARRPRRVTLAVLAVAIAGLMAASALGGLAFGRSLAGQSAANFSPSQLAPNVRNPISSLPTLPLPAAQSGSLSQQQIADKVTPAVVDINTTLGGTNGRTAQAAGTGMILTPSGEVLTNHHVVQGATSIQVDIPNRSGSFTARVLGIDPAADVALIQIEGVSGLPTVTLADSSKLSVGQSVVAIGNRLGQGGSAVTSGSITALDQSITAYDGQSSEDLTGLIQMDASISPGDSGGPLV